MGLVAIDQFEREEGHRASSGIVGIDAELKTYITDYLGFPGHSGAIAQSWSSSIRSMRGLSRRFLIRISLYRRGVTLDIQCLSDSIGYRKVSTRENGIDFLLRHYEVDVLVGPSRITESRCGERRCLAGAE